MQSASQKFVRSLLLLCIVACSAVPPLRRLLWRWWYGKLAKDFGTETWTFMNYGFMPSDAEQTLVLRPEDEPDRLCIQLYGQVVMSAGDQIKNKEVLEISSGRGGGASYLTRYYNPKKYIGVDFSPQAVLFSANRHKSVKNLEFIAGDAEHLAFANNSFDTVINVESSHCYGSTEKFLNEVSRILRPDGFFLFADIRGTAEMAQLKRLLASQKDLIQIKEQDISQNVIAALAADDIRKRAMIEKFVHPSLRFLFSEFAGVLGGKVYNALKNGNLQYVRFVFQRKN